MDPGICISKYIIYVGSYQNVFSPKVQIIVFTWGSASYCFHFHGPVQTYVNSA